MEWENIIYKARLIKESFLRSYKCLNTDRETKQETINKHINLLVEKLEQLRVLFNVNFSRLTQTHKTFAESFYLDIREKLISVSSRKGIDLTLPLSLHEPIVFTPLEITSDSTPTPTSETMAQTIVEFLNTSTRLLPEFDGTPENLQSFLDALELLNTIKGDHEIIAISIIKTKLKGSARNLISTETTIQDIIIKLKQSVKGDSVDVVLAKLMNVRQQGKTANNYAKEIEDLTKKLETSYINDGLPSTVAIKYATSSATKAIIKNASNDRVRLIMESGSFSDLNSVISKFISSCTDAYGQPNSILTLSHNSQQSNRNPNSFSRGNRVHRNHNPRNFDGNRSNRNNYNNNSYNRNGNYNNSANQTFSNSNNYGNSNANPRNNFRNYRGRNNTNNHQNANPRVYTMNADERSENGLIPEDIH